jgi:hypothetical protein
MSPSVVVCCLTGAWSGRGHDWWNKVDLRAHLSAHGYVDLRGAAVAIRTGADFSIDPSSDPLAPRVCLAKQVRVQLPTGPSIRVPCSVLLRVVSELQSLVDRLRFPNGWHAGCGHLKRTTPVW